MPVALDGRPALMRGEGERVAPVTLPAPLPAVLFNPGIACPTGPVFAAFDAAGGGQDFAELGPLPDFPDLDTLFDWLAAQRNDLEAPALALVPEIGPTTPLPPSCPAPCLTRMSGSGATFFALYPTLAAAQESADMLSAQHPEWWVRATLLGGTDPS